MCELLQKCRRSCCCCCTLLALILLSIVAIIFVGMLKGKTSIPPNFGEKRSHLGVNWALPIVLCLFILLIDVKWDVNQRMFGNWEKRNMRPAVPRTEPSEVIVSMRPFCCSWVGFFRNNYRWKYPIGFSEVFVCALALQVVNLSGRETQDKDWAGLKDRASNMFSVHSKITSEE